VFTLPAGEAAGKVISHNSAPDLMSDRRNSRSCSPGD